MTTKSEDVLQRLEAAVTAMTQPEKYRFDVTIICTTDDHQAEFWMSKLKGEKEEGGTSSSSSPFPMILAVSEDWNGGSGAGNGLGTLYAWQKAVQYAKDHKLLGDDDKDLTQQLLDGSISAALYHTAGKGTRLAPLPASENNNKPGVNLPFLKNGKPLTVLESVVRQTGIYGPSRKGRLSVFWGDQVFLPSVDKFEYTPTHHIDILCTLLGETAPTAEEWVAQGLDKYGVIAVLNKSNGKEEAAQVEKVSHETATKMLGKLGDIKQVGPSLGSFSISAAILTALCDEYQNELKEKEEKFDTDPHFWMPLTLGESDYVELMEQKGIDKDVSMKHYQRMKVFSEKFFPTNSSLGIFGAVNVGKDACWWDYGLIKLYSKNSLLLLDDTTTESALLRKFVGVTEPPQTKQDGNVTLTHSYLFGSKIGTGTVKDSIACNVTTKELIVDGAILVNCVAPKITAGKGCILYNLISENEIIAEPGQVMVQVEDEGSAEKGTGLVLKSRMDIDGGQAWKINVEGNDLSFEQVHKKNRDSNISKIEDERKAKRQKVATAFGM